MLLHRPPWCCCIFAILLRLPSSHAALHLGVQGHYESAMARATRPYSSTTQGISGPVVEGNRGLLASHFAHRLGISLSKSKVKPKQTPK
jgi:hypothetical protein